VESVPVVAVMLVAEELSTDGADENIAGFGVGGVVSGASVVVLAEDDTVPTFGVVAESRICTV
jgi:hypothetical protein